jgi:chromosome segregation ATPase
LKQENGSLKSRLEVHAGLEKTKQSLVDVNHRLEQKVKTLEVQVDNFDEKNSKAMKETELLRGKVKELEKKNEEVEKYDAELKKYNGHLEKYNDELKKHIAELEKEKTKLKKENDDLETDNNALAGNAAEHKKSLLGLNVLKEENAKLRAIIEELQKKPVVTTTAPADEGALKDLQKKLRESQEKLLESKENTTKLEASLQEWTELATVRLKLSLQLRY